MGENVDAWGRIAFLILGVGFVAAWCNGLTFLNDVLMEQEGLRVVLFRYLTIARIPYTEIVCAMEQRFFQPLPFTSDYRRFVKRHGFLLWPVRLTNRMLNDGCIIVLREGWFVRGIEFTPRDMDEVMAMFKAKKVPIESWSQS